MAKHLNNHHPESSNSRADKMSGHPKANGWKLGSYFKKFYTKKRRQLLRQNKEDKI